MAQYSDLWWYSDGTLATNQRAAVFEDDANTYASIFSDSGLTTPLANPTTTDGAGLLEFYAANGDYWIFVGEEATGDSVLVTLGPAATGTGTVNSVNGVLPDGAGNVEITASDVDAQPIGTINAKGDLYAGTADNATTRLPVGADGEVLTADSSDPTGMSWQAAGGGGGIPATLLDAKGDLISATAADTPARLGVGSDGQVLRANSAQSTGLEWDTLTAADVGADPAGSAAAAAAASQPLATINAKGDLYAGTANDTTTRQPVGSNGQVLRANSGQATGLEWDTLDAADVGAVPTSRIVAAGTGLSGGGDLSADRSFDVDYGTTAGTATEGNDSRVTGAQQRSTLTAKGDLYAATASAVTTRQPVGSDGQVLRADSGQSTGLTWDTLDAADVGADPAGSAAAAQAASQPLDADLTAIAGLTPANDDIIQRKAGAWTNRTVAQYKTDLAYTAAQVGAIANALVDAKGDIVTATANDTPARLAVGSDGQVLSANSATSTGLEWVAAGGGGIPATILDAKGDIIAASAADTAARLAVGSDNQVLRAASGQSTGLQWATLTASDVGAIASTLPDAKGDIITATAADTPARLAVGTNGQILTADSAQSSGLSWVFERSIAIFPRSTGFSPVGGIPYIRSSKAVTINAMYLLPFAILADATLTQIAFEVSGAVATALARTGIYAASASTLLPTGSPIVDNGTIDASTTGTKTVSLSQALTAGVYWLAFVGQTAAPTVRHMAGVSPFVANATFPSGSGTGWNNALVQTGVSGALPSIGSLADTDAPLCGVKF